MRDSEKARATVVPHKAQKTRRASSGIASATHPATSLRGSRPAPLPHTVSGSSEGFTTLASATNEYAPTTAVGVFLLFWSVCHAAAGARASFSVRMVEGAGAGVGLSVSGAT